jgi:small subunit ribosomal protein S17
MQDETENKEQEQQQPEPEAEATEGTTEGTTDAATEGAQEAPAPEEEPAADAPEPAEGADEAPAADAAPAEAEEPPEQLSPKQRRKRARAHGGGPAGPERSPEDRAGARVEARRKKAAERSRWRAKRREKLRASKSGEPVAPTPSSAAEPIKRKVRQGVVVSSKGDKTITVRIDAMRRHRVYGKVVRESSTLHAHDESNEANAGDVVRIVESRPLSRTKRWRLVDILERAR